MLPIYLRNLAKRTLAKKKHVNLAVFGPGHGSPYFEKRQLTVNTIREQFPDIQIKFYMIDDLLDPVTSYEDYVARLLPEEIRQIEWADIILLLVTHHRLTAFVEFILAREAERVIGEPMMSKCAIAIFGDVLNAVPSVWAYEARRLLDGNPDRIITFANDDLKSCRVATDMGVELFERVAIERWG
jgi:hypothetical protein